MDKGTAAIILISFILIGLIAMIAIPKAFGIDRVEEQALKEKIKSAETEIEKIELNLSKVREKIKTNQNQTDTTREELREAKRNSDGGWNAIRLIYDLEVELAQITKTWQESREEMFDLLREKSDYIKLIKNSTAVLENNIVVQNKTIVREEYDIGDQTKKVGVKLSNICIVMIKNNFPTDCPSYKQLVILDSSDTNLSGKFTTIDGFFHRAEPKSNYSWKFYDGENKIRLFIDPPLGMAERIKMITIAPSLDTYKFGAKTIHQGYNYTNLTVEGHYTNTTKVIQVKTLDQKFARVLYHDWFIDDCKNAVISAKGWTDFLPKVLYELRNNCPNDFIGKQEIIYPNYTEIDITTSPDWQYRQWLEAAKERCKVKC